MRIETLKIENFRNISRLEMDDIPDVVVLAGANGCGKSSVLDAIALAKEATGAYRGATTDPKQINAGADYAEITIVVKTTELERDYIKEHYDQTLDEICTTVVRLTRVERRGRARPQHTDPGLRELFTVYARRAAPRVGVVEYLPAQRSLTPKHVNSYSATFLDEQRWKESALFPQQSRFDDIKEYLAGLAVQAAQEAERRVLADGEQISRENWPDQFGEIRDVFSRFFSPMEFEGVKISENPFQYIISTPAGRIDLDDLSDGEKSIFTIAFDIIRRDLQNSIILFDEPEQHLHPDLAHRFVQALPSLREGNQFWLATHSAGVLRSAELDSVYRVTKYGEEGTSQIQRVFSDEDMRGTLVDLVGELGLVTLNKRIVFLEGSGPEIDRYILETLYADELDEVQFVSCGSVKRQTEVSAKILDLLSESSKFNFFYAIRDRDFMTEEEKSEVEAKGNERLWVWDVYHIENFLLDWQVLFDAASDLTGPACPFSDPQEVKHTCHQIAQQMANEFLAQRLDQYILEAFERPQRSVDPSRPADHAKKVGQAMVDTIQHNLSQIEEWTTTEEERISSALDDGTWTQLLPGRPVLRRLAGELNVNYRQLRNVAVSKLAEQGAPLGLERIMEQILKSEQQSPSAENASQDHRDDSSR